MQRKSLSNICFICIVFCVPLCIGIIQVNRNLDQSDKPQKPERTTNNFCLIILFLAIIIPIYSMYFTNTTPISKPQHVQYLSELDQDTSTFQQQLASHEMMKGIPLLALMKLVVILRMILQMYYYDK